MEEISIFHFPYVVLNLVLQFMHVKELFLVSTLSNRSRKIVRSQSPKQQHDVEIHEFWSGSSRFNLRRSTSDVCEINIAVDSSLKYRTRYSSIGGKIFYIDLIRSIVRIRCLNSEDGVNIFLSLCKNAFGPGNLSISPNFNSTNRMLIPMIVAFSRKEGVKFKNVSMKHSQNDKRRLDYERLVMDNSFFDARSVRFDGFTQNSNYLLKDPRFSSIKRLSLGSSAWFTYQHFKRLTKCTSFVLKCSSFTVKDINKLLKDWKESKMDGIKFNIEMFPRDDIDQALEGLNATPLTQAYYYPSFPGLGEPTKVEITKSDGKRVVIFYDELVPSLFVATD